jgi:hypothetical protein
MKCSVVKENEYLLKDQSLKKENKEIMALRINFNYPNPLFLSASL